ncbi:2OG-Fe(II) oxygenase [Tsuneonella sp. SYSU-LHT278]|uniref:2OG-Fe(II) oxygenase n=1 Tax=Tsuneonella sediminis TaxID=3416089 RepID=UPI003F7A5177
MSKTLFAVNPEADLPGARARFSQTGRAQVRDFLMPGAAREIRSLLEDGTPWGLSVQAGESDPPEQVRADELQADPAVRRRVADRAREAHRAAGAGQFAFVHARYSLVEAYLGRWNPDGAHDILLEHLNTPDFLDPLRALTGIPEIVKADAHASLFAPGHFLTSHLDEHSGEGRRVAYVLNFAPDDWYTDWGGYLVFFDADGDIVEGFRPRFNSLNLFRVPQAHSVTFVPPFAPATRLAISGWLLDR